MRTVDLADVRANVLNAFAEKDNVVPREAAEPATTVIGQPGRREELRLPGGHVTFATGRVAFNHTLPALSDWMVAHSVELDPPKER
jgi:poly(3-hydroxyalkanoate) synthetase